MTEEKNTFFAKCYSTYFNQLKFYAYAVLGSWGQAEEATQAVFLSSFRNRDALEAAPSPVKWLTEELKGILENIRNADAARTAYFMALSDSQDGPGGAERCASFLSAEEYGMLRRSVLERATYAEMAEERGVTLWSCQKRMQQLMKKLQSQFAHQSL